MAECPIDGSKIGFIGGWVLKDGEICANCGKKVGFQKGDSASEAAAHSYTLNEVRQLMNNHATFDPNHAKQVIQKDVKRAQNGDTEEDFIDEKFLKDYIKRFNMENLDSDTQDAVNKIISKMSSFGYARVVATLNSVLERYQITLNQTQIEQNWVLIKQQDETNKLLRQLVEKK